MNKQGSIIAAWGGHAIDLWRWAKFEVSNPHSYSKVRQIKAVGRRSGVRVFIETGTYLGNTSMRCSGSFDRVITVELDPDLYRRASEYLAKRTNVECIQGDALKALPGILARPDVSDALVFLDGHFSEGDTALGDLAEPACEEIKVLAQHRDKIAGFVVDDFRLFGVQSGWPRKSELLRSVEDHFGATHEFTVHLDQLVAWRRRG